MTIAERHLKGRIIPRRHLEKGSYWGRNLNDLGITYVIVRPIKDTSMLTQISLTVSHDEIANLHFPERMIADELRRARRKLKDYR